MVYLIGIFSISFFSLGASAHDGAMDKASRPVCTAELLKSKCPDFTNSALDLRKHPTEADGMIFNLFAATDPKNSAAIKALAIDNTELSEKRALKLAEDIKISALQFVSRGRSDSELSIETLSILARLRTVKFMVVDSFSRDCYADGDPGTPNAIYNQAKHAVLICSSSLKINSSWIAATIAHELGHVVSPCAMSATFVKFNEPTEAINKCLGVEGFEEDSRTHAVVLDVDSYSDMLHCKAAEILPGSGLKNIESYQDFNRCTEIKNKTDYEKWIALEVFGVPIVPNKNLPPKIQSAIQLKKATLPPVCYRKNEESFADGFGGHVYSGWSSSKKIGRNKFELGFSDFTSQSCFEKFHPARQRARLEYPTPVERIESFLKSKFAQDLFKCEVPKTHSCFFSEDTFKSTSSTSESAEKTPPVRQGVVK